MTSPHGHRLSYPFAVPVRLDLDPQYEECRRSEALTPVQPPYGDPSWLATRHEDIRTVLADPRFSRAEASRRDEPRVSPSPMGSGPLGMDPPEHTRHRQFLAAMLAFTPQRLEELRHDMFTHAHSLTDVMAAQGPPCDLVGDFVKPFASHVVYDLLGIPVGDRSDFLHWSEAFTNITLAVEDIQSRSVDLFEYIVKIITAWRGSGGGSDIAQLSEKATRRLPDLTDQELIEHLGQIIIAGPDITSAQLSNGLYALLSNPDQFDALRENPDLIPNAAEEILRYAPFPSHATFARYATEDIKIGATLVRQGEPVLAALASGNRDRSVFADPDVFDIERTDNAHLSFGFGPHQCIGAPLVRLQVQTALALLTDRFPRLRLAVPKADLPWRADPHIRRVERLPVTW
ncbi:cytochrome P450 [Streptomyces sp. NBC_01408]|uniref:cytochrome P450 n=1 Tax=Streptomyces sp. NBC_01408 TaxID=2903855 RepID=UPI0022538859|nr:cytochrome P450 [Streptomyces sp. NBC_01408]MCX4695662.1 cytochrome P450 [Streptomyces sp. NBC_01408]